MARPATGQVLEREGQHGTTFALRFRAHGRRQYLTLGTTEGGWTKARAETELENVLADVRRALWQEPQPAPIVQESRPEPSLHEFASEWLEMRTAEGLADRTIEDYAWALSYHLLPYFGDHLLSQIGVREVDAYKLHKAGEGVLGANTTNKTLSILAQVLELAVEYGLLSANPARGRRRRLPYTRPRRTFVQPEQLMALLEASEPYLNGRGRPLLATLAGAGLRIGEALALERRHVNLARGTLTVEHSKTETGVRVVELIDSLREELTLWLDRSPLKAPTDLVFGTSQGKRDNRQNVRRRLLVKAAGKANAKLAEAGIEPIGQVGPHGLRRTYFTLRLLLRDDPVWVAQQGGHTDPAFSMRVYAQAVKHRERLAPAEREASDRALEWARMGTNEPILLEPVSEQKTAGVY